MDAFIKEKNPSLEKMSKNGLLAWKKKVSKVDNLETAFLLN